ncbi:uncharacterized protein C8Q71DRAFT_859508 [Rhodofomes roseus]|uniref:Uncharacterized protein n=1 Tax=Rhodofomes roseus TaxID=34475 RepID=A0ABQ8KAI5_9APHY|nr:uncharacterized protein C8Q71DRAFT_859508 [Rhodofomes roseus]KAH9834518.1 hypothetical protein C8Q71DRAFT_859508 [Rhodofomes roseus]
MSTSPPLRKLNSHVSLLDSSRVQSPNPLHPSVILLFGWLEAEPAYLQKYVDRLHANFPTSTIVLIKADTSWYFSSESSLEKEVLPAVHTIRRELSDADRTRGVLVHVLSNGGALQLVTLRKALAKSGATEHPASRRSRLPIALVLDSTPASSELASAIQSWAPANTLMRWLAIPPITMLYTGFYIANALAGHPPVFRAIRDELKSADLLPTVTNRGEPEAIPRAYFTSNKDVITPMKDVETHYAEVVALGFDATIERFVGSAHVSHARLDPDRYWRAVNNVWKRALQKSGHGRVLASL